jgi:hypothetical protein
MGKRRKQQTDTLPMGDAIELYVQTLHRKRRPLSMEDRAEVERLEVSLNNALNMYDVPVTLACRFEPGQSFESLGPGEEMAPMKEQLKDGARKACCGVPEPSDRKKGVLGKIKNPLKRK